jgi:hypothetical protein
MELHMQSFKRICSAVLAAAAVLAVTACGGGNTAFAAPLADNFVAGNGTLVAGTGSAIRVAKVTGGVHVTIEAVACDGSGANCALAPVVQVVADANSAFWNSFVLQANANGWYRNGSANEYFSGKRALVVQCVGGSLSQFSYASVSYNTSVDSCNAYNAVKAASNQ